MAGRRSLDNYPSTQAGQLQSILGADIGLEARIVPDIGKSLDGKSKPSDEWRTQAAGDIRDHIDEVDGPSHLSRIEGYALRIDQLKLREQLEKIAATKLAKQPREYGFGAGDGRAREPLAAVQEAAVAIRDGERITVAAVAHPELALEVGAPDLVRRHDQGVRLAWMADHAARRPAQDQALPLEQIANRGALR